MWKWAHLGRRLVEGNDTDDNCDHSCTAGGVAIGVGRPDNSLT
jgi:hypothetical protein